MRSTHKYTLSFYIKQDSVLLPERLDVSAFAPSAPDFTGFSGVPSDYSSRSFDHLRDSLLRFGFRQSSVTVLWLCYFHYHSTINGFCQRF